MNFFEHQQRARTSSRRLVALFALATVGIVVVLDLMVWLVTRSPEAVVLMTVLVPTVIIVSSLVRVAMLRGGGAEVARSMGATPVAEDTREPSLRRLRNVVEEIAIASSVPMPQVYVMEEEAGINAFAAGYSPNDAVIAVTRGALQRLNRAELQGVIAHEFSHILNGDMRLNIRLMGVLFGIMVVSIIGRRILMHVRGGRDSRGVAAVLMIGAALALAGYVGLFFGRLIKAGVSRSRENLADASAVQFTRQTDGLAGALKKIAGLPDGSRLGGAGTEEVSHMLFGEGLGFSSWFATHPPILERIKAIDPSFDAKAFETVRARWMRTPPNGAEEDRALGFAPDGTRLAAAANLPDARAPVNIEPLAVAAQVGAPALDDVQRAEAISGALTDELRDLARRQDRAVPLVLALLLDADAGLRQRQLAEVAQIIDPATAAATLELHDTVSRLHPMLRLPLAALAFPVLRRRPRPDLARFLSCCERLIGLDGRVSLSEYCLGRLLRRQVVESLDPSRHAPIGRRKLVTLQAEVETLLAVVAQQGHDSALEARRAYLTGMERALPGAATRYAPPPDFVAALEGALALLDQVEPRGKALLVEGLVATIGHDGEVSVVEAELLRTICAVLHCPLPPMLEH